MRGIGWGRRLGRAGCAGLAAVVLAVGVAACDGKSGSGTGSGKTTIGKTRPDSDGPSSGVGGNPSASPTPSQLRAADFVLTAGPATAGFTGAPGSPSDDGDDSARIAAAECVGVDYVPAQETDRAAGDTFVSREDQLVQVSSEAKILPASDVAISAQIVTDPAFGDCFWQQLENTLASAADDRVEYEIVAVETPPAPDGATALIRVSLGITDDTGTYGFVLDTIYFYVGQVAVQLQYQNVGNIPPADVEQAMVDQIAGKLAAQ
ncbi:MAG: hypothetical protein IRZ08_15715 [Frankia sp.]|nr:hypothetical protein [Frankia sp.]